jgi:hypothetical protein
MYWEQSLLWLKVNARNDECMTMIESFFNAIAGTILAMISHIFSPAQKFQL